VVERPVLFDDEDDVIELLSGLFDFLAGILLERGLGGHALLDERGELVDVGAGTVAREEVIGECPGGQEDDDGLEDAAPPPAPAAHPRAVHAVPVEPISQP
jgi:hypothetical protein